MGSQKNCETCARAGTPVESDPHGKAASEPGAKLDAGKASPPGCPGGAKAAAPSAFAVQEGGNHYKQMKIQPVEFIHANGIGFIEGSVIKYVSRWRAKGGIEDLRKARHFLDMLIEAEGREQ